MSQGSGIVHAGSLEWLRVVTHEIEQDYKLILSPTPVFTLQWHVKMAAVKRAYYLHLLDTNTPLTLFLT